MERYILSFVFGWFSVPAACPESQSHPRLSSIFRLPPLLTHSTHTDRVFIYTCTQCTHTHTQIYARTQWSFYIRFVCIYICRMQSSANTKINCCLFIRQSKCLSLVLVSWVALSLCFFSQWILMWSLRQDHLQHFTHFLLEYTMRSICEPKKKVFLIRRMISSTFRSLKKSWRKRAKERRGGGELQGAHLIIYVI